MGSTVQAEETAPVAEPLPEPKKNQELAAIFRYPLFLRLHGGVGFAQRARQQDGISLAAGLFVENRLFDWFLLSIGLMAYVPLDEPKPTPIGISTKLGWAPQYHRVINAFAVIRADWIFDDRIIGILSADFGISLSLRSRRSKRLGVPTKS